MPSIALSAVKEINEKVQKSRLEIAEQEKEIEVMTAMCQKLDYLLGDMRSTILILNQEDNSTQVDYYIGYKIHEAPHSTVIDGRSQDISVDIDITEPSTIIGLCNLLKVNLGTLLMQSKVILNQYEFDLDKDDKWTLENTEKIVEEFNKEYFGQRSENNGING